MQGRCLSLICQSHDHGSPPPLSSLCQDKESSDLLDEDSQSILNIIRDTASTLSSESCDCHMTPDMCINHCWLSY